MPEESALRVRHAVAAFAVAGYGTWALLPGEVWTLEGMGVLGSAVVVLFVGFVAGMVLSGLGRSLKAMTIPHPAEPGVERCPECNGDGRLTGEHCAACESTGVVL
jgi:hypothetical protein